MKKQYQMACLSYDKLWGTEFYYKISAKDRVQDINPNQLKLKVNDNYKKDEKLLTIFEPSIDQDVINEAYLDTNISKIQGHCSYVQKIIMNSN